MTNWTTNSWRNFKGLHLPEYPDESKLRDVENRLSSYPPIVFAGEARELKRSLSKVVDRQAFLLQGGDLSLIHI